MPKTSTSDEPAHSQILAVLVVIWAIDESKWRVTADAVANLCLSLRWTMQLPLFLWFCIPSVSRYCMWIWTPRATGICPTSKLLSLIDVCSIIRAEVSLNQGKCDEFSIGSPSNAGDVFQLALRGLNTFGEKR